MKKISFNGAIVLLGFGSVGRAMLPVLLRHIEGHKGIRVVEKDDSSAYFKETYGDSGVEYEMMEITRDNWSSKLKQLVSPGDMLVDVSVNVDAHYICDYCLKNSVIYINTSIERWLDEPDEKLSLSERTLYSEHQEMRKFRQKYPAGTSATCIVTHGANPGLVSHFVKHALLLMAQELKLKVTTPDSQTGWAALMDYLGVKVVHISERDTQTLSVPKQPGEFVNTWSCEGFWAEGRAPAEMGWGTHEPVMPKHVFAFEQGPCNSVYWDKPGVSVLAKSWAPKAGEFNGFCIQHSEAITISDYFTLRKSGKVMFRPTVHYVYCPCDAALASVHEFKGQELNFQRKQRIARDEIVSGIDELGVLLLGEKISMWYGSQLSIEESRKILPGQNATALQVVGSMLGAIAWAIQNPKRGYVEPEEIPFDHVLNWAAPYLGPLAAVKTNWTPTVFQNKLFPRTNDHGHPWAFSNFRVY